MRNIIELCRSRDTKTYSPVIRQQMSSLAAKLAGIRAGRETEIRQGVGAQTLLLN